MLIKQSVKKPVRRNKISKLPKSNSGSCLTFTIFFSFIWGFFWLYLTETLIMKGPTLYSPVLILPKGLQNNRFSILPGLFIFTIIFGAILGKLIEHSKKFEFWTKIYLFGSAIIASFGALVATYALLYGYVIFK